MTQHDPEPQTPCTCDDPSGQERPEWTLEAVFGSVKPRIDGVDIDERIRAAKEERVERWIEENLRG